MLGGIWFTEVFLMISAQRRNEIIDTGIVSVYTQYRFNSRLGKYDIADGFFNDFHNYNDDEKKDGIRVFNSNSQRLFRLHKRIKKRSHQLMASFKLLYKMSSINFLSVFSSDVYSPFSTH